MDQISVDERVKSSLAAAREAAAAGDVEALTRTLYEEGFLAGLVAMLRRSLGRLTDAEIETAVAKGVTRTINKARSGARLPDLPGFLWLSCWGEGKKLNQLKAFEPPEVEELADTRPGPDALMDQQPDRSDELLRQLIGLIPQIAGQSNQDVVQCYVEAYVNGDLDMDASHVGQVLGLKPATVRKCKERGLARLRILCAENGITLGESTVAKIGLVS